MAYDIYGEILARGHCEVHPFVHEEYPCSLCMRERQRHDAEEAEYNRYCKAQEDAYYAAMMGDIEYESWNWISKEDAA